MTAPAQRAGIRPGDALVAAVLVFLGLVGTAPAGQNQPEAVTPDTLAYVLVVAAAVSVVGWRRWPAQVFVVTGAVVAGYLALGYPFGPVLFSGAFAAGALAVRLPLRPVALLAALGMGVVGVALLVRATVAGPPGWFLAVSHLLFTVVWVALPAAVGVAVRVRREAAERVRSEQARRAVSEERLRMAQEVHDVVGHGLAVIAMQAGAGLHVLDRDPERARATLEAIQRTSRESLDGLRAELAVLRGENQDDSAGAEGGGGHREAAARTPRAGLSDVPVLVDRVRSGGLDVHLEIDEPEEPPPDQVGLAAYRIVQEALTNVLRHGGPTATAQVTVRAARDRLVVEVVDSGAAREEQMYAEGSGITGMRDRARGVGGDLDAGPRPGGGFRVGARLPLRAPTVTEDPR